MRRFKLLGSALSTVAILAACAAWIALSVPATGWQALVVPTRSMQPAISAGSLVFVRSVSVSTLRVGDVITYKSPLDMRKTITHRIIQTYLIARRIKGFITKGDANKVADIPVASGDVSGKVIGSLPYAGLALEWARTWPGTIVLIYIPALLVIVGEVRRLHTYYDRFIQYRLLGYRYAQPVSGRAPALWAALSVAVVFSLVISVWSPVVWAMVHSNAVALAHNSLKMNHASGNGDNDDQGENQQ